MPQRTYDLEMRVAEFAEELVRVFNASVSTARKNLAASSR